MASVHRPRFIVFASFVLIAGSSLPVDAAVSLVQTGGQDLFETKCAACHSLGSDRVVGPGLAGVSDRRDRAWMVDFIVAPDRVIADGDSIAARLLEEYQVPMPNLGLTQGEAERVLDYMSANDAVVSEDAAVLAAGDADVGRRIFTGEQRLANGGPACISCHAVGGLPLLGGGTLAKDLRATAMTYGDGLASVLQTTPFPVMQDIFSRHPLTDEEISDLVAFLTQAGDEDAPGGSRIAFPVAGFTGTFLLLVLAGLMWRSRLRGVRRPLIGGRS